MELTIREMAEILHTTVKGPLTEKLAHRKVSLSTDSRTISRSQVFWALKGDTFDGHAYTKACFEKGAWAAVVNRDWFRRRAVKGWIYLPVKDTTKALLKLAGAYGEKFSIPKISLTGSNGKTTTKDMLVRVLSRTGKVLGTKGNLNNHIGVPLTLFELNSSHKYAVVEMGTSSPGEIKPLARTVKADIGIITNIGHSHTEFFGTPAGVYREKRNITEGFGHHSVLMVNADDKYLSRLEKTCSCRLVTFGIERGQVRASRVILDGEGCASFTVGRTRFHLRVTGKHNVYNALAAIAAGRQLKIPMRVISRALGSFKSGGRRMEVKKTKGIKIYDDCYNANPVSMEAALEILKNSRIKGRTIAVLGDMKELGPQARQLHYDLGLKTAQKEIHELYGLGSLAKEIGRGARSGGMDKEQIHMYKDIGSLNKNLGRRIRTGDAVLIKGSRTMRMEKVTEYLMGKRSN
jgi:UDP-N-acetylmuramoyl-tripeptide--D-alanyl-D-alanine ligase